MGIAALVAGYAALTFGIFVVASLLYRRRRVRIVPEAVIILGAGLIEGQVPPLLAGRLRRGLEVQRRFEPRPFIIASGGQGPDEPRPEATAMREYLIGCGAAPGAIMAETESRSTRENLQLSRGLLSHPQAPVLVVTSSYHVFRAALLSRSVGMRAHVLGAKTAWYHLPSGLLREYLGVIRIHLWVHLSIVGVLAVLVAMCSMSSGLR